MKTWHQVSKQETVIIINHKQSNFHNCKLDGSIVKDKINLASILFWIYNS